MTIIEQRAAESVASALPRILKELKRANNLKALSIQMGIEEGKRNTETRDFATLENLRKHERTLEAIMEGI